MPDGKSLLDYMLIDTPCELRRFTKPEFAAAYWCDQCRIITRSIDCQRERLADTLRRIPQP